MIFNKKYIFWKRILLTKWDQGSLICKSPSQYEGQNFPDISLTEFPAYSSWRKREYVLWRVQIQALPYITCVDLEQLVNLYGQIGFFFISKIRRSDNIYVINCCE